MPPLTRQEQRDREEFVNRYMREHPDADDVEAEDLWEDRREGPAGAGEPVGLGDESAGSPGSSVGLSGPSGEGA